MKPIRKIQLISEGKLYNEDSPFRCGYVEIYEPTPEQEELLVNPDYVSQGKSVDMFINALLVNKEIDINQLTGIDKVGVIIQIRIITYGFEINLPYTCPSCGAKQDITMDVNEDIQINPPLANYNSEEDLYYKFKYDGKDAVIKFHFLTTKEDEEILRDVQKLINNKNQKNKRILTGKNIKCIDEIIIGKDKFENLQAINEFVTKKISTLDRAKFTKYYQSFFPTIETGKEITCGRCGKSTYEEIPLITEIFLSPLYI